MEHLVRLIEAALAELELEPEEVTSVEIDHSPWTIWSVFVNDETYVFFDCSGRTEKWYKPYTTVEPFTAEELATYGILPVESEAN